MQWKIFSRLVMIEQSLFGLPWVLTAALLPFIDPSQQVRIGESGHGFWLGFWIIVAFLAARTAGMAFNRLIDQQIDAQNPRTRGRPIQTGEVSTTQVAAVAWSSTALFIASCAALGPLCLLLSPLAVALLLLYSYAKRFTAGCHFILGLIQCLGPIFAWAALSDSWSPVPLLLGSALFASIAAMDIVYALQDLDFDRRAGLHSVPVLVGVQGSLWIARALHITTVLLLLAVGEILPLKPLFQIGVACIAALYLYCHWQIDPRQPSRINKLFFQCNSFVGLILLFFTIGALAWHALS